MSTTDVSSLLRHHGDTGTEAQWVTRLCAAAAVQRVDVLDEMTNERSLVRDRVVWMEQRIGDAGAGRSVVTCDVEGSEVGDRNRQRCAGCVSERAVRRQVDADDALVPLREAVSPPG